MEPIEPLRRVSDMHVSASIDAASVQPASEDVETVEPMVTSEFERFYRDERATITRALAISIGHAEVAAEATDEAMVRAYERWSHVSHLDRPEAWVYRVASNWALSTFRRHRRSFHRMYEPAVDDRGSRFDPAIDAAVAALDVKHRSVVVCRYLLGWSVTDTAAALGIREGTVKSRLSRATATLRIRLENHNADEEPS
jgi:RNA polymerase sigma-70 factor (ECF subfamily)